MNDRGRLSWLGCGVLLGLLAGVLWVGNQPAARAGNDRYEDYIIATGAVAISPKAPTDGVWLLDYRGGKLLATLIDRLQGKIIGWAEVDLVNEFNITPRQNVHFMMTTGMIAEGQAALYVAETSSGKIGVYTMGQRADGKPGVHIKRHDMVMFRNNKE
jgi:hypothetical protein